MPELEGIEFRKANKEDIKDIIDFRMIFLNDYKNHAEDDASEVLRTNIRDYLNVSLPQNDFIAFLAYKDDKVVASGGMEVRKVAPRYGPISNGKMAYIMNMYTLPVYRKKGLGTKILKLMIQEAKDLGISHIHLHASKDGDGIYREAKFKDHELPELVLELQ